MNIEEICKVIKEKLDKAEGTVEVGGIDHFKAGIAATEELCRVTGIQLHDELLGEILFINSLVEQLEYHRFLIVIMVFPDGDRYELVTRYNKKKGEVRNFCYKL